MSDALDQLEARIGYRFQDRSLLSRALTHSSHAYEAAQTEPGKEFPPGRDNERLEFLGDSILGFLISEWLVSNFDSYAEGRLSKLKAHLVSASHLVGVARRLDMGSYLRLGRGEELSGGRGKRTLLADSLEALIAAIYLDSGMDAARMFLRSQVLPEDLSAIEAEVERAFADFKGMLQEVARQRKLPAPRYVVLQEAGPGHARVFTVEARVGPEWTAQGEGSSKKNAAQRAARDLLEKLGMPSAAVGSGVAEIGAGHE